MNPVSQGISSLANTQSGKVVSKFGNDLNRTLQNIGTGTGAALQTFVSQPLANIKVKNMEKSQSLASQAMQEKIRQQQGLPSQQNIPYLINQSRAYSNTPDFTSSNLKFAESNLQKRIDTGTQQTGIKPFMQYAAPAVNVALTGKGLQTLGAMPLLQKAGTLGLSGGISGLAGALSGQNPLDSTIAGILQTPRIVGLTGISSPATKYGAAGIMDKISSPLSRNIMGRGLTGLGNVIEDEILSRLDNINPKVADRVLSFGIGAFLAPVKEYEDYLKSERPEVAQRIRQVVRDIQGRYAKKIGVSPESLNYFVTSSGRKVVKGEAPKMFGQDVEKINKFLEDNIPGAKQGFGNIAEPVGGNNAVMNADISKGLTPEVNPLKIEADRLLNKPSMTKSELSRYSKIGDAIKLEDDVDFFTKQVQRAKEIGNSEYISETQPILDRKIGELANIQKQLSGLTPEVKTTSQVPSTATRTELPVASKQSSTPQIEVPKSNKVLSTNAQAIIPPKNATPEQVASTLPGRIDNFVDRVLGYSTKAPEGGNREASLYTRTLRGLENKFTTGVETAMGSENNLIRNAATNLQNLFRGAGMSPERSSASMNLRGEMATANERAFNIMDSLYKSLKNDKKSLARINAVLDPSLSKTKVSLSDLSPTERQVYEVIREGLDLVHDTSYANGHISSELYSTNRGKYVPRLYDVTELPPEVGSFLSQGKKMANDLYKSRKDIDEWKIENSLNDPVYGLGKRLAQVETNKAIKGYTDFLANNSRFVSDVERPGFTKLSDSKAYGNLSGKYVLNSAAEDLKGFFFSNQAVQNLYDVFRAYDRMPIRQLQKKLLTVFNPTTNVGNIVSDQVFGFVTGVDPLTLNANLLKLKNNPKEFKQLNDYLLRKGITGTDITRTDFVNKLGSINDLAEGKTQNIFSKSVNKIQSFYGGTDDVYKVSAFKALLDKGFTLEEATRKVADGFQNYANVGKFYDVWSKTPVIGSTFIKFQGDLMRIIKNGAVNNPMGLISFLGTLWGVARLSSKLSGETDENREYRENRFGAPMIPGLKIPLTWQTPMGEINAARYISPFFANNDVTNLGKMLPFFPNIDTKKDVASNIAMNANDPLLSPIVNLAVNRDFRGKPISDPKENKYQPSTLTPEERLKNQAIFAGRAYTPPPVNSAIDVYSASQGRPNMYGAKQSTNQALARLGGIKVSQFGPEEVAQAKQKDAEYQSYKNESIDKQINSVYKQQLKGEITPEQTTKRIQNLESQKVNPNQTQTTPSKTNQITTGSNIPVYRYLDDKGSMQTIDLSKPLVQPEKTGQTELDKKKTSKFKEEITSRINDIVKLNEEKQISDSEAEGLIKELKLQSAKLSGPKKVSFKSLKAPKLPKIKISKGKTPKIKLAKLKTKSYKFKPIKIARSKTIKLRKIA